MGAALLLAGITLAFQAPPGSNGQPYYIEASIANTAASIADYYAPNSFVTIYGLNLSDSTTSLTGTELQTILPGSHVTVLINNLLADLWYVSPTQINLLIPSELTAGPATVQIEVNGFAGPPVGIMLSAVAPAMYQTDATTVLAAHLNGQVVSASSPAQPGELVVLYATGLGPTVPPAIPNQAPQMAATLATPGFGVWLNGTQVDPSAVPYAGVTPGYAGLYQINLIIPENTPANPQIQIGWAGQLSPAQVFLPVE